MYGKGGRHAMLSQMMGPSFVYKTFHDVGLNNIPDELQSLAQKAYRAAFKVALGRPMDIFKVLKLSLHMLANKEFKNNGQKVCLSCLTF